ncbi:hypothetical protein BWP39_30510 [Paraburkholderia acidicola]|uniref:Response regulatory domain-containing protein n=1 Tax=Paraburkholderia acidicola TaxID=1912599 RepID=A0A2A4EUD4_9BURK|nr:helix-turn-helix domain-containing protein [Paraburkholderia acidicola]PCE24018.1 hypothetical protein BWP39_30510 [Paraburkholderia acidicola]
MPEIDGDLAEARAIASRVRELLESHGIGKRQHAGEIQRICALSYSQALRKIKGLNPWTINQLKAVALAYGESPAFFIENIPVQGALLPQASRDKAWLVIEQRSYECVAEIGAPFSTGVPPQFVAISVDHRWHIYPHASVPPGQHYEVKSIEIAVKAGPHTPVIAVLDDEPVVTEQICTYLGTHGFIAKGYVRHLEFARDFSTSRFDAYVIDWMLDNTTARASIERIAEHYSNDAPIYLLTGKIVTGEADEGEMAEIIQKYEIFPIEKPVRLPWLVAELTRRLKGERSGG